MLATFLGRSSVPGPATPAANRRGDTDSLVVGGAVASRA